MRAIIEKRRHVLYYSWNGKHHARTDSVTLSDRMRYD